MKASSSKRSISAYWIWRMRKSKLRRNETELNNSEPLSTLTRRLFKTRFKCLTMV